MNDGEKPVKNAIGRAVPGCGVRRGRYAVRDAAAGTRGGRRMRHLPEVRTATAQTALLRETQRKPHQAHDERHDPRNAALEHHDAEGPFAAQFAADAGYGGNARRIQQAERQQ